MAKADHDALYHRFFSDPAIQAQLLREFVAGPWLELEQQWLLEGEQRGGERGRQRGEASPVADRHAGGPE